MEKQKSNKAGLSTSEGGFILLNTMLQWSALLYSFTTLRDLVHDYDETVNQDSHDVTVPFVDPDLIYTQHVKGKKNPYNLTGQHLKYPVSAKQILEFIHKNRQFLTDVTGTIELANKDGSPDEGDKPLLMIEKRLDDLDEFDADIVEFDDEFMEEGFHSELVFAVIVNRTQKRITVVFRGSVSPKDFFVDLSMQMVTPDLIDDFASKETQIHVGFAEYLFGKTLDENGLSKYHQILDILQQLYAKPMYKNFELYLSGHSLGGSLSQLMAFTLAGRIDMDGLPIKRVIAISYASPRVGNKRYQEEFTCLECEGKLRHIRVSNEGDIIPVSPWGGYYQTGVNLHVNPEGRATTIHNKNTSLMSQINPGMLGKHSLISYNERMFVDENEDILDMDVDQLYAAYGNLDMYDVDEIRSRKPQSGGLFASCCDGE